MDTVTPGKEGQVVTVVPLGRRDEKDAKPLRRSSMASIVAPRMGPS